MLIFLRTEKRFVTTAAAPVGERGSMLPSGRLRAHVDAIRWGRDTFAPAVSERLLPDGAVHLFFQLGERPSACVVGASAGATTLRLEGTVVQIGVQLRPGGMHAILGVPARELAGREVALDALWGAAAGEIVDRLLPASTAEQIAIVGSWLEARLGDSTFDPRAARALRAIADHPRRVCELAPSSASASAGSRRSSIARWGSRPRWRPGSRACVAPSIGCSTGTRARGPRSRPRAATTIRRT